MPQTNIVCMFRLSYDIMLRSRHLVKYLGEVSLLFGKDDILANTVKGCCSLKAENKTHPLAVRILCNYTIANTLARRTNINCIDCFPTRPEKQWPASLTESPHCVVLTIVT